MKEITRLLFVLLVLGFKSVIYSQDKPVDLFNKILIEAEENYTEKVYLHTDKPFYSSGETLWYKSYLVNAIDHKASQKSRVIYVDLINPNDSLVFDAKLYIPKDDLGIAGDIEISPKWESGNYQLRGYTNYMRNEDEAYIFRKSIFIQQSKKKKKLEVVDFKSVPKFESANPFINNETQFIDDLKVVFYPEGGEIVANQENILGIKVFNKEEQGIQLNGIIREQASKQTIGYFRTFEFGLGKAVLHFENNKTYEAVIKTNEKEKVFVLPKPSLGAKKLNIIKKPKEIILNVISNQSVFNHFVIGHQRGKVVFNKEISNKGLDKGVKLITKNLPSGVVHFTLFDPSGKPLSERLVFIDNPGSEKLELNAKSLEKRARVEYSLEKLDHKFDRADLSVSVTAKETIPLNSGDHIKSWMLLNSDLRGEVPNAATFFDTNKTQYQQDYLLESLMLTHGWRRFNWGSIVADSYKKQEKITPEKGVTITGQIFAKNQQYAANKIEANLFFMGQSSQIETAILSPNEKFSFGPFNVKDSLRTMLVAKLQGVKKKEEKDLVLLFDKTLQRPKINKIPSHSTLDAHPFLKRYTKKQDFFDIVDFTFNGDNLLEETILTIEKKTTENIYDEILDNSPASYSFPTHRLILDSLPGAQGQTAIDMLNRIAGVRVGGAFPNYTVSIRGGNSASSGVSANPGEASGNPLVGNGPLFLLDGAISDINFVNNIQAVDVSFIDVLAGPDASIYGGLGGNGVIVLLFI